MPHDLLNSLLVAAASAIRDGQAVVLAGLIDMCQRVGCCTFNKVISEFERVGTDSMLVQATIRGHVGIVERLLDRGVHVNRRDSNGYTALHDACAQEDTIDVIRMLIDRGAKIDARDGCEGTPLIKAARWGNLGALGALLDAGADIEGCVDGLVDSTPLIHALENDRFSAAQQLVMRGANVNAKGPEGDAPLHYAARVGRLDLIETLLAHGSDVSTTTLDGSTVLSIATAAGQLAAVRLLEQHWPRLWIPELY